VPVKYHRCRGSQTNKYDLNSFANVKNDRDESQMASGRYRKLFQVRGPAMANDLSPNEVCVCGKWSFPLSADLIGRHLDDRTLPTV